MVESTKSWLGQPSRHRTLSQPTKLTKPLISIGVENKNQGKLEVRLGNWVMIWALFSTVLIYRYYQKVCTYGYSCALGPFPPGTSTGWLSMESTFFWHSRVRKKYGGGSTPNWVSHKPSWMNTSPDRLFFPGKGWGTWENGEGLCRKPGMSKSKKQGGGWMERNLWNNQF